MIAPERYASARARLLPGKASDFIRPFSAIRPGDRVVLVVRVSHCTQDHKGSLDRQEAFLRREVERRGAVVVARPVQHVGSGIDPFWIRPAVEIAIRTGPGVKIVAEATDRFVRHPVYHSTNKCRELQARKSDLENLHSCACGITLVTFLHPDTPPVDVERHRSVRGQAQTGNFGGRPQRKKHRRRKLLPQARDLRSRKMSIRQIAKQLGVAHTTIADWLK